MKILEGVFIVIFTAMMAVIASNVSNTLPDTFALGASTIAGVSLIHLIFSLGGDL